MDITIILIKSSVNPDITILGPKFQKKIFKSSNVFLHIWNSALESKLLKEDRALRMRTSLVQQEGLQMLIQEQA